MASVATAAAAGEAGFCVACAGGGTCVPQAISGSRARPAAKGPKRMETSWDEAGVAGDMPRQVQRRPSPAAAQQLHGALLGGASRARSAGDGEGLDAVVVPV